MTSSTSNSKFTLNYRPEIDGLRAIAVISVIIYHLQISLFDFPVLSGGFLGVDIFFVISGYLITSIILKELNATSKFSFLTFYERRARRILPILLVVITSSFVIGWFLLFPSAYLDLSKSILYTLGFSSNFYFFLSETEYQAVSSLFKPLLHTWSLAVEEQYYIIFPVILILLYKYFKNHVFKLLTLAIVINLCLIHLTGNLKLSPPYIEDNFKFVAPTFIFDFYFLTSRFWELLLGSCLAYIGMNKINKNQNNIHNSSISLIGLVCIAVPLFLYNDDMFHPSVFTLLPVIGVSLVIHFTTGKENIVKKMLSKKIMVGIGLISYSLYLWHYPIFAFGRINQSYDVSNLHKIIWITLAILLSIFSYFYIERPFRDKSIINKSILLKSLIFTCLLILVSNILILKNNGYKTRFNHLSEFYGTIEFDNDFLNDESWKYLKGFRPFEDNKKTKILIVGDGHSKDIFNCFYQNADLFPNYQFRRLGYDNDTALSIGSFHSEVREEDKKSVKSLLSSNKNFIESEIIIIADRFLQDEVDALPILIDYLQKFSKKIILLSRTNEYLTLETPLRTQVDIALLKLFKKNIKFGIEERKKLEKIMYKKRMVDEYEDINTQLSKIAKEYKIKYLKKQDFLCDEENKTCDAFTSEGYKIYYDYGHYTLKGAKYLGEKIYNMKWFQMK